MNDSDCNQLKNEDLYSLVHFSADKGDHSSLKRIPHTLLKRGKWENDHPVLKDVHIQFSKDEQRLNRVKNC